MGAVLLAASLVLVSCSGSASPTPAHTPSTDRIVFQSNQSVILTDQGATYQLTARVETASGVPVTEPPRWSSDAPDQVSVSPTGLLTAKTGTGSATITVSAFGAPSGVADQ